MELIPSFVCAGSLVDKMGGLAMTVDETIILLQIINTILNKQKRIPLIVFTIVSVILYQLVLFKLLM